MKALIPKKVVDEISREKPVEFVRIQDYGGRKAIDLIKEKAKKITLELFRKLQNRKDESITDMPEEYLMNEYPKEWERLQERKYAFKLKIFLFKKLQ